MNQKQMLKSATARLARMQEIVNELDAIRNGWVGASIKTIRSLRNEWNSLVASFA